jgi:type IV secretory pathway VirB2 component (pilin)
MYAILAVWVAMTLIGFVSTRALLLRWFGSAIGATVGAGIYVFGGYFANRFNAGHITFSFFHWIPLLIYLFDVTFDRMLERRPILWPLLFTILASFLFLSSGLPHPLLHFYPVLLLFMAIRVSRAAVSIRFRDALRAASLPVIANLLGIWLAAYKLWPVIAWQLRFPRKHVGWESYSLTEVVSNTLLFVTDYLSPAQQQPWHQFVAWGYNAFVGPVPWVCAILALIAACQARRRRGSEEGVAFGLLLVVIGISLSLGNDNPWSPSYLFRHFPILEGIRNFNRYQIFIVFGLAILTARGFAGLTQWLHDQREWAWTATWTLALAALAPVVLQTLLLVAIIPAASHEEIATRHSIPQASGPPKLVPARKRRPHTQGRQTVVLEQGNWVGDCKSDITLPGRVPTAPKRIQPVSEPPPIRIESLSHDRITLQYGEIGSTAVRVNLRMLDEFEANVPLKGEATFRGEDLRNGLFSLTADYRSPRQGRHASGIGLLATFLFLTSVAGFERRTAQEAARDGPSIGPSGE